MCCGVMGCVLMRGDWCGLVLRVVVRFELRVLGCWFVVVWVGVCCLCCSVCVGWVL